MTDVPGCWHRLAPEACLARLDSSPGGLSTAEAQARLARDGANRLPHKPPPGLVRLFGRQFLSPLIYLLLAAAGVSILLGDWTDAGFILVVLSLNAGIGAFQEWQAGDSAAALQRMIRLAARVRRDGRLADVPADQLVAGDIVLLTAGQRVPADIRLLSAIDLTVNEAALTGESGAVVKDARAVVADHAMLAERATLLHAGTTVAQGRAEGVVVATGGGTALGQIALSLADVPPVPPPLLVRLERFSRWLAVATVAIIILLGLLQYARGMGAADIFFLAVALAVSAIPEGLPVAITVALSIAARRMAGRHVIVRALPAVEGLGACSMIATDKTGTLTVNRLAAERLVLPDGRALDRAALDAATLATPVVADLMEALVLCNEAEGDGDDAVDAALLALADGAALDVTALRGAAALVDLLPYEPARRSGAVVVSQAGIPRLLVKGAAETVLPMCGAGADHPAHGLAETFAAAGYRVLAVAGRTLDTPPADGIASALHDLSLLGFVGLIDPVRPEVPAAIADCRAAGIGVTMVTGDHPATALAIGRAIGLAVAPDAVVTGAELARLADDPAAFDARVARSAIFARVEPAQKLAIVQAMQRAGHWVAVTGDGVNDAPALTAADIGVAMGAGGTDVAREAADLLLTDDNFASIVHGVEEGRVVYDNIRKIVLMLLTTGLAEILLFVAALALGLPPPLTAVQLLWLNLVTNGVQDIGLAFERGERDTLRRPPRTSAESLLDRRMLAVMLPVSLYMMVTAIWLYQRLLADGAEVEAARNVVLLLMVLFENAIVLTVRSERAPAFLRSPLGNPVLLLAVAAGLGLQVASQYLPWVGSTLGSGPVAGDLWLTVLAMAAGLVVITELAKALAQLGSNPDSSSTVPAR
ncbi:cation-translocating P-type ATPase [Parapedomonas caeni]